MTNEGMRALTTSDLGQLLGKEVVKIDMKKLTAPGENYGSEMVAIDATLKSGKVVSLVAKMFPLSDVARKVFQSPVSMKKEIGVYQIISPEYEKIQEEESVPPSQRLHVFCTCPAARLSLKDTDEDQLADENSVLLLENLKMQGYRIGDRVIGQDLNHTEFVMRRLAKFHATAIAIKLKKPLVFRNKLLKVLFPLKLSMGTKEESMTQTETLLNGLNTIPACKKHIGKLRALFKYGMEIAVSDKFPETREPFATIMHYDFWTNNMMFKCNPENDDDPIDYKIVDFQITQYGSPVSDLFLFLFTSTELGIVSEHIDNLIKLYHDTFVEWLKILRCETKKFSYESFLKEVQIAGPLSLIHIIFLLMPITFSQEQVENNQSKPDDEIRPPEFNDVYISKVSEAVDTFSAKGWL